MAVRSSSANFRVAVSAYDVPVQIQREVVDQRNRFTVHIHRRGILLSPN
jgi:hypothetical protein